MSYNQIHAHAYKIKITALVIHLYFDVSCLKNQVIEIHTSQKILILPEQVLPLRTGVGMLFSKYL